MAVKTSKSKMEKKEKYSEKLQKLVDEYSKILVVKADNVGSMQMQQIRQGLRDDSVILMGKNTLMKRALKVYIQESGNNHVKPLLNLLVGNVGLIFTRGDLKEVREEIGKYKVGAPARVGLIAPVDVVIPAGNTGLDPSQTGFFQALNIPTKINKGTVEIVTPIDLIKKGEKVGQSESTILSKLQVKPFSYGLVVEKVFEDGTVYDPEILDLTEDDLAEKFASGVANVAALAISISYPTIVAASHMFLNAYKNVLAVAISTDYSFPQAEKVKEFLKDPSKFAVAVAATAATDGGDVSAGGAKEEEKKEESDESDEENMFSLFD